MNYINNMVWQIQNSDENLAFNLDYESSSIWKVPILDKDATDLPFYIQEVGYTVANENYFVRRNSLDSFFIGVVVDGAMSLKYANNNSVVKPGDCLWMDCRKPHAHGTAHGTKRMAAYFVHFYGPGAIRYSEYFSEFSSTGIVSGDCFQTTTMYLKKLLDLYRDDNRTIYTDFAACSMLTTLCQTLLEACYVPQQQYIPEYIGGIRRYLEENYMEHISLADLSAMFFLSPSYLQKQFKRYLRISPSAYLNAVRIKHAKQFLRSTRNSVTAIGEAVGFADTSYFVRTFGKAEGISPLQYRKLWTGE